MPCAYPEETLRGVGPKAATLYELIAFYGRGNVDCCSRYLMWAFRNSSAGP